MRMTRMLKEFIESEQSGGILLIACTIISLLLSNSPVGETYMNLWHVNIGEYPLEFWINDGLMAVFFLLVGLELKREVFVGELSDIQKASLPVVGAIGGMLVPALLFLMINMGTETQNGFGIPMATDIAFAVGILSLLGNRVPASLKIFLLALAVIDDLGAIIVIAIFYSKDVSLLHLAISLGIFVVLLILNKRKVNYMLLYVAGGVAMWYFMHHSGVHATITGVLLAFAIPFDKGSENSLSSKLEHALHQPVSFVIMPLFALANTSILIDDTWTESLLHDSGLGILVGLVVGKPLGIFFLCFIAVKLGIGQLTKGFQWKHLLGVGFMAGIGFTMSIFVTMLAYDDAIVVNHSKIAILVASTASALIGYIYLRLILKKKKN